MNSHEDLKERKKEANRTEWRFVSEKHDKVEKTRKRTHQKIHERKEHLQVQLTATAKRVHEWVELENVRKAKARKLHLSLEEVAMIMEIEKEAARKSIMKIHRGIIKRARLAGDTPDLDLSNVNTTEMRDTVPICSGKKRKQTKDEAFHWIPVKGSQVRVLWSDSHTKIAGSTRRGIWQSGRVTELCWPSEQATPGAFIRYDSDHVEEWHSIEMFGDTVELIKVPKDKLKPLNNGTKETVSITHKEQFPKEATEWLGYGASLQVRFGKRWCLGKVIGREGDKVMVSYSDGVGTHSDLHTRGCRIRSCRKRIDLDKMYRECPWMKCPYKGQQDGCECWPCRTVKWPERYGQWGLTESEISEFESETPGKRKSKNKARVKNNLRIENNRKKKRGRPSVADGQHGSGEEGERGGGPTEEEVGKGQGKDGPQTRARARGNTLKRRCMHNRETEGSDSLDGHDGTDCNQETHKQRHVPTAGAHGAADGERTGGNGPGTNGSGAQSRDRSVGKRMAEGERGAERGRARHKAGQVDSAQGRTQETGGEQRRSGRTPSCGHAAERRRESDDAAETKQASEQGQMGQLGGGLGKMDGGTRLGVVRGGRESECESTQHGTTARGEGTHDPSTEPGGGLEVSRERSGGGLPGSGGSRSGQEGLHLGRDGGGKDHGRAPARLVNSDDGPDNSTVKEGGGECESVEPGDPGTGVHTVQRGECNEHGGRHSARKVGNATTEPSECNLRENRGRDGGLRSGNKRSGDSADVTREAPLHTVHRRKSSRLGALVPPGGAGDPTEEQGLGYQRGRQVCLRQGGEEANEVPHEQTGVEAERENGGREVLRGEMHWDADSGGEDRAPTSDAGKQQGEESRLREAGRGTKGMDGKGGGKCHRKGAHTGGLSDNNEVCGKRPTPPGPNRDDDDGRCKRREKPEAAALRRQNLKGRTREGGTQGGKRADAPDD